MREHSRISISKDRNSDQTRDGGEQFRGTIQPLRHLWPVQIMREKRTKNGGNERERAFGNHGRARCARTDPGDRAPRLYLLYQRLPENEKWPRPADVSASGGGRVGSLAATPGRTSNTAREE